MKKVLTIMVLLFFLVGCNKVSNSNIANEDDVMKDVYIAEIEWCGIAWDQIQHPIDLLNGIDIEITPIETNKNALDIAITIIEKIHEKGKFPEYTLISIMHSTKDNIWRFEYSIDQRNKDIENLVDCGCLYVAIDGNNGTLIKAWLEE